MAKNFCTYIPDKGLSLFMELKKLFGYDIARKVFLTAIHPNFIEDFKGTLSLDAEGIPSYDSLMRNSYIKKLIGITPILKSLNNNYSEIEDTLDNYNSLLETAFLFNTLSQYKDDFIAIVEHTKEGIRVTIKPKILDNINTFNNLYSSNKLNNKLANIFKPLGVTVEMLSLVEMSAGRIGVTDFNKAKDIANGFSSMIKIANNMEGAQALSEEFSHLIIGIFKDDIIVTRAIRSLSSRPEALEAILGDEYEDVVRFYDNDLLKVAEEALGHLLQKNLLSEDSNLKISTPSLIKRSFNFIKNKFRGYNYREVELAIIDADSSMSKLAKEIINGTRTITREDVLRSQRNIQLNALSNRIERNINILKEAAKVEAKRYRITKESKREISDDFVINILKYTKLDSDTIEGLMYYALAALDQLKVLDAGFNTFDRLPTQSKFEFLRSVRSYNLSFGNFIKALNEAKDDSREDLEDDTFTRIFTDDLNDEYSLNNILTELNSLSNLLYSSFTKKAFPAFAEFLKPFLGEDLVIPTGKNKGKKMSIENLLLEASSDISFLDRWLDSMADSSDLLLQLFDAVVKKARDAARLKTLDDIKDIQLWMLDAERLGITSFDWMFETDSDGNKSGNYISEVNYALFDKDYADLQKELDEEYGINPKGELASEKIKKERAWLQVNSINLFGDPIPNPAKYQNKDYENLSDDKKKLLKRFLDLKLKFDNKLPENRVSLYKAVLMRKTTGNRIIESASSPSTLFGNIKNAVSESILDREDDDLIFGDNLTKKGLTDFSGLEYMTLPVLYTNRLKNPNELSTDVVASLMAYAYMANNYEEMDKIVDPLEVGRIIATDPESRKIRKTRGDNPLIEKMNSIGIEVINKVFVPSGSNIQAKLNDFFESLIYERYLKDEGTFDIFGKKVNVAKLSNLLLKGSSMAQLGFNWIANAANVANGIAMLNIEAACKEFFSASELAKADAIYIAEMKDYALEIGSRIKTSKLALFDELFNIKLDFSANVKRNLKKNLLLKIFGENVAFLGQEAGDHWLYNRTAIAMALRKKVMLDGREMSLWDALRVQDRFKDNSLIKELNYRDIKELDGNSLDVSKFSREVAHVNLTLFGIYNDEDANAANRLAAGRFIMLYRKWMKPLFNKRFLKGQFNLATRKWEEGYYRTLLRIGNELLRGQVQLGMVWNSLNDLEKRNIIRVLVEQFLILTVLALANLVEWPDDKKRPWYLKMTELMVKREAHELPALAPSPTFIQETLKTIKTPMAILSTALNTANLAISLASPADWTNELLSGPYKGMSTLEKNFWKSPIIGVAQYRLIEKFMDDLDTSIMYYMRPY